MALSPVGQQNTTYDSSPPAATQALRQATVLVVDDEEPVLTNARQLLEALRVTVCTARSTAEALQVIGSVRIDLALVDWRLTAPDDGLALGQLLSREFGIPFVLISGYLDTDATGNAYKLGAADVVDKPLRPERLLAAVNVGLRHQPRVPAHQTFPVAAESGIDSNAERWAHLVLEACRAQKDQNTEPAAARAAGVSTSAFREACWACEVGPRETRDFIRFMRALSRSRENASPLRYHLGIRGCTHTPLSPDKTYTGIRSLSAAK